MPLNPYVINWMIDLLSNRKQRVKVDGIVTEFLDINRGVPQGTVLGPMMFLLMTNDIRVTNPINQMPKFADDITIVAPVFNNVDLAAAEVENIKTWSEENKMPLNMSKTYEIVVRGKMCATPPNRIPSITRKTWLKILGVTVEETPGKWDIHFEEMLKKTSERMYILRVCKYYGFTKEQLDLLFQSLIMPLFTFAVEIWGGASHSKYISKIDKFINRAHRNGYTKNRSDFKKLIIDRDMRLWTKITKDTSNALYNPLPNKLNRPLRQRGHEFELPSLKTERFKNSFVNRCLFKFI